MKTEIKAVIFDMDGVLIDAREWHYLALNMALEPFGLEISLEDHLNRFNGLSTKQKLKILSTERNLPIDLHPIIEKVKQDRTLRIAAANCFPNPSHQVLLSRLKNAEVKIGLYTNSIRATTEYMLKAANIIQYFDSIVTNQDVQDPKPNPEGYLLSANKLEELPANCLVVEDGEYGILAATNAGCLVVKVESPNDVNLELLLKKLPNLVGGQG